MIGPIDRLNERNTAGGCKLQLVPVGNVASVPTETYGSIAQAITLSGGSWVDVVPTRFTHEFKETWDASKGAQMATAVVEAVIPKDRVDLLWGLWLLHGDRYLVLHHDQNGTVKLMGTKAEPAIVRIEELTHGRDPRADRNQYVLRCTVSRRSACPFYLPAPPVVSPVAPYEPPVDPDATVRVRLRSTTNVNLASAPGTYDGVAASPGDLVLLVDQSAPAENGVWQFNGTGSPLTRPSPYDTFDNLANSLVLVDQGTSWGNTLWYCTSDVGGTLGATALNYVQFGGVGPTYTADEDTLQLVAGEFSVKHLVLRAIATLTGAANKIVRLTGAATADLLDFDTDPDLFANSNTRIPSQRAVKLYVDGAMASLSARGRVVAASTANVTVSSAPATLDGVTLANGQTVLLKNQSTPSENGVYVFLTAGNPLVRSNEYTTLNALSTTLIAVDQGSSWGDTVWLCTSPLGGTLGVDPVTYIQFGAAAVYTADDATLELVGGEFRVKDAELLALAGLSSAANKVPRFTGPGTADLLTFDNDPDLFSNSQTRIPSQWAVKTYVDGLFSQQAVKGEVRVASTANVTVSSAPASMDGVTLVTGDRVLLKNQSAPEENGVYLFFVAGNPLVRTNDYSTWNDLSTALIAVSEGSAQADTMWFCTSNAGGTLGTTPVTWARFGAPYSADGTTLELVGNEFRVKDVELLAIAGLSSAANKVPRFTGPGTADLLDFDTDPDLFANSNTRIPSQRAVKTYVDGLFSQQALKGEVRAASTANVTVSSAPATLDGVTLVNGDRVLLKNQSALAQNGVYLFLVAGNPLVRTNDYNTWDDLSSALIAVSEGTVNADTLWFCTSNAGGTLGTTPVSFAPFGVPYVHPDHTGDVQSAGDGAVVVLQAGKTFAFVGVSTPAALSGDVDEYDPAANSTSVTFRLSSTTAVRIGGFQAPSDGRLIILQNVGSNTISLTNEEPAALSSYRFTLRSNITLAQDESLTLMYDASSERWRDIASSVRASAGGGVSESLAIAYAVAL